MHVHAWQAGEELGRQAAARSKNERDQACGLLDARTARQQPGWWAKDDEERPALIGIFGAGRNGTTLLMRLLDGSPGLWVYPIELNYLSVHHPKPWRCRIARLLRGRDHAETSFLAWAEAQGRELRETYLDRLMDPLTIQSNPVDALRTRGYQGSPRTDLPDYLSAMQAAYDDRHLASAPFLVFKSREVTEMPQYQKMFPQMRFIHIVRHPFSNYSSLKRTDMVAKRMPFWFQGGDILRTQLEDRWIPHVRFILEACQSDPGRHFILKYEDLCEQPSEVISGICRWLGVAPPSDVSMQTVLGGKRMTQLPSSPSQAGVDTPPRVVSNMASAFNYEEVLTERERALILFRTYGLARQLGYFETEPASLPTRMELLRAWLLPDRWECMNTHPGPRLLRALLSRRLYIFSKLVLPSF